jgi:hypothetical protein
VIRNRLWAERRGHGRGIVNLALNRNEGRRFGQVKAARIALLLSVLIVASCSSKVDEKRKPVFPVRGKVLVQGKPAAGAFVLFVPVNEPSQPVDPRPRAEASADGSFELSTYGTNDGAPAGEYVVSVTWPGGVLPDGREEPPDKLMGRYEMGKSKLKATVKEGQNDLPPFQL